MDLGANRCSTVADAAAIQFLDRRDGHCFCSGPPRQGCIVAGCAPGGPVDLLSGSRLVRSVRMRFLARGINYLAADARP